MYTSAWDLRISQSSSSKQAYILLSSHSMLVQHNSRSDIFTQSGVGHCKGYCLGHGRVIHQDVLRLPAALFFPRHD